LLQHQFAQAPGRYWRLNNENNTLWAITDL